VRTFLVSLLLLASAFGQEERRDAYGDPLPDHVIARLGSGRFRHPMECRRIASHRSGSAPNPA